MKPIYAVAGAIFLAVLMGGSLFFNSMTREAAPGKADALLAQISLSSDEIWVMEIDPKGPQRPDDPSQRRGYTPKFNRVATLRGDQIRQMLREIRLSDGELKPFDRQFPLRLQWMRKGRVLGAADIAFSRDRATMQAAEDADDSPFKGSRPFQPGYGRRFRAFLESVK